MSVYRPTELQAATSAATGETDPWALEDADRWAVQISMIDGASADVTIYGRVSADAEWTDITEADLTGLDASVIQDGDAPLQAIYIAWANLAGGTMAVHGLKRRLTQ